MQDKKKVWNKNKIILIIVWIFSCSSDEKPPQDILGQEKMASILTDIHIAEARVGRLQLRSSDSSLMVYNELKEDIWKKQKVDTLVYKKSYDYYMTHPNQMSQIYEKVKKQIEEKEKTKNIYPWLITISA